MKTTRSSAGRSYSGFGKMSRGAARFRDAVRVGECVSGRVVGLIASDMAEVEIRGGRLTARVNRPYVKGERAFFEVESLWPEVVLKERRASDLGKGDVFTVLNLAIDQFEKKIAPLRKFCVAQDWESLFFAEVSSSAELCAAYLELRDLEIKANFVLASSGRVFRYLPWVDPHLLRIESLNVGNVLIGCATHQKLGRRASRTVLEISGDMQQLSAEIAVDGDFWISVDTKFTLLFLQKPQRTGLDLKV